MLLLTQVTSGVILLAGAVVLVGSNGIAITALSAETLGGTLAFGFISRFHSSMAGCGMLIPGQVSGTVIWARLPQSSPSTCWRSVLPAYMLVWFGVVMTLFPVFSLT